MAIPRHYNIAECRLQRISDRRLTWGAITGWTSKQSASRGSIWQRLSRHDFKANPKKKCNLNDDIELGKPVDCLDQLFVQVKPEISGRKAF
jgi:hypothetical protein